MTRPAPPVHRVRRRSRWERNAHPRQVRAGLGHPEWGRFRLGLTDPNGSDPGLEGVLAVYHAAAGRSGDVTGADAAGHPYAVLSAPWVTDAKRAAAEAFLAYLRSGAGGLGRPATGIGRQQPIRRPASQPGTSAIGTRVCVMVSRSRMVTASSVRVSKSTVRQNGVPISSCRR